MAKTDLATKVGELVAQRCQENGIKSVVFDRNGFRYHGRVKAIADGAREAGLTFKLQKRGEANGTNRPRRNERIRRTRGTH